MTVTDIIQEVIANHSIPPHVDPIEPAVYIPAGKNEAGVMTYVAEKSCRDIYMEQARPVAEAIVLVLKEKGVIS